MLTQEHSIFKIRNLQCQYSTGPVVLSINQLDIPSGKLIFVLGISGVGKSTFIETLGLMNKTIIPTDETSLTFYPANNDEGIELKNYWEKDNDALSLFRSQYLSFIFQNTNLMPNFTAGENMCISQLLSGESLVSAKEKVLEAMEELKLPKSVFDKPIMELSGGQRQRLAFVRAITSNFKILFGDEPTGNLDKNTAYRLMQMLKSGLKGRTSIMVSHDIDLALKFADQIILLTLNPEKNCGEVLKKNILFKKDQDWEDVKKVPVQEPEKYIYELIANIEV